MLKTFEDLTDKLNVGFFRNDGNPYIYHVAGGVIISYFESRLLKIRELRRDNYIILQDIGPQQAYNIIKSFEKEQEYVFTREFPN